ncbi:glycine betaine ABC transporter substrate-binding protein [Candidatus Poriferisodalis sp.]|uniref:glycine betaine ABC transporter substrate-binding protein n=1 Tax=Candidatus Poriferisodalis sp. TaxID=3101277 RepID=UPI003C6FB391
MSEVRKSDARTRRHRKLGSWQLLIALIAGLGLFAAACTGGDDLGSQESITLAANPWNGSALNVAVAAQLLESELGYDVEIVEIDENGQWAAINTGDLSASLEVWPSGHAQNVIDFIDNAGANVDNAGLLGPIGKIGWFIPTYMVERHPELATWEGFADPELAGLFATAETGDLGQFLGGDPSFVQYDEDIINNLGLPLQVVYAGSEAAILAAVDAAYSREDPILVYLWTPHSAFNSYDLTNVLLPTYSDDCYGTADAGGVDCDYPADVLFKIIDASLASNAPSADNFLRAMSYDSADQIAMLAAVEGEGMSVDDAAAQWIADNEATWSAWLQ